MRKTASLLVQMAACTFGLLALSDCKDNIQPSLPTRTLEAKAGPLKDEQVGDDRTELVNITLLGATTDTGANLCGNQPATITRVIDGDTVVGKLDTSGKSFYARMLGIDAPELKDPNPAVQEIALAAKLQLSKMIDQAAQRVVFKPAKGYGCFFREKRRIRGNIIPGRWLARLFVAGRDAAPILVRMKLACPKRTKKNCDPR